MDDYSDNDVDTVDNTSDQELSDDDMITRAPKLHALSMYSFLSLLSNSFYFVLMVLRMIKVILRIYEISVI